MSSKKIIQKNFPYSTYYSEIKEYIISKIMRNSTFHSKPNQVQITQIAHMLQNGIYNDIFIGPPSR